MAEEKKSEANATGRRKTAVARVLLAPGTGKFKVNGKELKDYFHSEALKIYVEQPLKLTNTQDKFNVEAKATGGGISGQAGAVRHALARALTMVDASLREVLKDSGCLTRDPRMKERKKSGQPGARKRFQFSKR
ncbi:MAG: 30S ribosomal protein S9 [Verrucomicrobia bacterium]|nr:30S ribosomal protein S9 [Verrucomicrobiota bacterium]